MTAGGVAGVGAGLVVFDPCAQIGVVVPIDMTATMAASEISFNRKVFVIMFSPGRVRTADKQNSDAIRHFVFSCAVRVPLANKIAKVPVILFSSGSRRTTKYQSNGRNNHCILSFGTAPGPLIPVNK